MLKARFRFVVGRQLRFPDDFDSEMEEEEDEDEDAVVEEVVGKAEEDDADALFCLTECVVGMPGIANRGLKLLVGMRANKGFPPNPLFPFSCSSVSFFAVDSAIEVRAASRATRWPLAGKLSPDRDSFGTRGPNFASEDDANSRTLALVVEPMDAIAFCRRQ